MTIAYSAVGKGLYDLQTPPSGILDTFHIDLTAVGSDVRMLELSLQPTQYVRGKGQTVYTWDYKRLLFGRPSRSTCWASHPSIASVNSPGLVRPAW